MAKAALPPAAQLGQSGIRAAGIRHCLSAALAVLCLARGLDGELRRQAAAQTAIVYAFDLVKHNGEDLYGRLDRKAELARLLRNTEAGILSNEPASFPTNTSPRMALPFLRTHAGLAPRASPPSG